MGQAGSGREAEVRHTRGLSLSGSPAVSVAEEAEATRRARAQEHCCRYAAPACRLFRFPLLPPTLILRCVVGWG